MDVKNTFTGDDRHSVLESCEGGEDAALKAYKDALDADDPLSCVCIFTFSILHASRLVI